MDVTLKLDGRNLWGLEKDDTCLGVKVKAQDQTGASVSTIRLTRLVEYQWGGRPGVSEHSHRYKQPVGISDNALPFNYTEPLSICHRGGTTGRRR